jgi:hypothetical protein
MWFGEVEHISDGRPAAVMGLKTLDGDVKGNLAALADVHITPTTFKGPWSTQASGTTGSLLGVCAADSTHVWTVGYTGIILYNVCVAGVWGICARYRISTEAGKERHLGIACRSGARRQAGVFKGGSNGTV